MAEETILKALLAVEQAAERAKNGEDAADAGRDAAGRDAEVVLQWATSRLRGAGVDDLDCGSRYCVHTRTVFSAKRGYVERSDGWTGTHRCHPWSILLEVGVRKFLKKLEKRLVQVAEARRSEAEAQEAVHTIAGAFGVRKE